MHNKPDLGSLKTFLIDPLRNWLITVTSRGFYTCWDLRFLIPIKTWRHSIATKHSIYRVAPSPPSKQQNSRSSPLFFAATGGNEVQLWDIESAVTRQVLRAMPEGDPQPQSTPAIMYNPHSQDFGTDDLQRQVLNFPPYVLWEFVFSRDEALFIVGPDDFVPALDASDTDWSQRVHHRHAQLCHHCGNR